MDFFSILFIPDDTFLGALQIENTHCERMNEWMNEWEGWERGNNKHMDACVAMH